MKTSPLLLLIALPLIVSFKLPTQNEHLRCVIEVNDQGLDVVYSIIVKGESNGVIKRVRGSYRPGGIVFAQDTALAWIRSVELDSLTLIIHDSYGYQDSLVECERMPVGYAIKLDVGAMRSEYFTVNIQSCCLKQYSYLLRPEILESAANLHRHYFLSRVGVAGRKYLVPQFLYNEF